MTAPTVHIAKGTIVEEPIHLLFFATQTETEAIHPRVLVVSEAGAKRKVVETYAGEGVYFTNAVTEVVVGTGAVLEHTKVQEESETAFHVATIEVRQAAAARTTRTTSHSAGNWRGTT